MTVIDILCKPAEYVKDSDSLRSNQLMPGHTYS